jgi:hypothetical protein
LTRFVSARRLFRALAVVGFGTVLLGASKFGWIGELQSRIQKCWRVPAGLDKRIEIRVTFALNRDGTLAGDPTLAEISAVHLVGADVAKSDIDAIKLCQPYSFLPADQYTNGWDNLDMTFTINPTTSREGSPSGPHWLRDSSKLGIDREAPSTRQ